VCDISTHALHILSGQGYILTCKVMPPPSLQPPPSQYQLMYCQQQLCLCYYLL
jgi:hypothetical protein